MDENCKEVLSFVKLMFYMKLSNNITSVTDFIFPMVDLLGGSRGSIQLCDGSADFSCNPEHGPLSSGRQEIRYILLFHKVRMCDRLI